MGYDHPVNCCGLQTCLAEGVSAVGLVESPCTLIFLGFVAFMRLRHAMAERMALNLLSVWWLVAAAAAEGIRMHITKRAH